jgi:hypothetical protein
VRPRVAAMSLEIRLPVHHSGFWASEGRGHRFESCLVRHVFNGLDLFIDGRTENVRKTSSDEFVRVGTVLHALRGEEASDSPF